MFGVGLPELAVIALVAVLVFGPDRLPELAKQAGQMVRKLRTFANAARDELREELGPEFADLELRDLDPREIVKKTIREALEDEDEDSDDSDESSKADKAEKPNLTKQDDDEPDEPTVSMTKAADEHAEKLATAVPLEDGEIPPYDVDAT